jgi:exodeoxyribonuclease VII large subunit
VAADVAPGTTRESAIPVATFNEGVRAIVEQAFGRVWIRGEISDFKRHKSGHWYFSMRDARAKVSCVVWSKDQWAIPAAPDDGMQVVALVQATVWPAQGSLQLSVRRIEAVGDGLWRKAMQETVERLKSEGLLAPERKRRLPRYPRCIAVVTSSSGAAIRDIISVAGRRRPGIRIVVSPAVVQGDEAVSSICAAIRRADSLKYVDVIIVGRGGGSREDLWAFNDERVARAIAGSRIPVISAVGHEIDTTVCDLVADVRAATPSAAAETAVPALSDMQAALELHRRRLRTAVLRRGQNASRELVKVARDMRAAAVRSVERRRATLGSQAGRLNALSPLATLARGYAVARDAEGHTLSSVASFKPGMLFDLRVRDGSVAARVVAGGTAGNGYMGDRGDNGETARREHSQ